MVLKTVYHGTGKRNAESIKCMGFRDNCFPRYTLKEIKNKNALREKNFKLPGTLGYGVYAFWDDKEMALNFASEHCEHPSVIEFDIMYDDNNVLKFDGQTEDSKKFNEWIKDPRIQNMQTHLREKYRNDPGKQHSLDGAIIELFIDYLQKEYKIETEAVIMPTHTNIASQISMLIPNGLEVAIRTEKIIEMDTLKLVKIS